MRRRVVSIVAALGIAGGTALAAWAQTARSRVTAEASSEGRNALVKAIAVWRDKGAARLMQSMDGRRRIVIDIEEESAAHDALTVLESPPALSPVVPSVAPGPIVAPVQSLPQAGNFATTHDRQIVVSESGLAKVDLSTLLVDSDAGRGVVIDALPAGLIPVVGDAVDGGRWFVGREDFADFALVMGVGPEERFDLRVGRVEPDGSYHLTALVMIELQWPKMAAGDAAEAASDVALPVVPLKAPVLAAKADGAKRKEKTAVVTRPSPKKAVSEADDDDQPVAKPSRKTIPQKVVNETVLVHKPSALGARVPGRSAKRASPPAPEAASDAPWWTKAKHFTVEDIR